MPNKIRTKNKILTKKHLLNPLCDNKSKHVYPRLSLFLRGLCEKPLCEKPISQKETAQKTQLHPSKSHNFDCNSSPRKFLPTIIPLGSINKFWGMD